MNRDGSSLKKCFGVSEEPGPPLEAVNEYIKNPFD